LAILSDSERKSNILPTSGPRGMPGGAMAIPHGPKAKAAVLAARPAAVMPVVARVKAAAAVVLETAATFLAGAIWAAAVAALRIEADIRFVAGTVRAVEVFRPLTAVAAMAVCPAKTREELAICVCVRARLRFTLATLAMASAEAVAWALSCRIAFCVAIVEASRASCRRTASPLVTLGALTACAEVAAVAEYAWRVLEDAIRAAVRASVVPVS